MKIFVVTMRNSIRKEKIKNYLSSFNLDFKISHALPEKRMLSLLKNIKYHKKQMKQNGVLIDRDFSFAEISILLNHLKLIFYIYKKSFNDKSFMIIEDDIKFKKDPREYLYLFDNLEFNYDLLRIGYPLYKEKPVDYIDDALRQSNLKDVNDMQALQKKFYADSHLLTQFLSGPAYVLSRSGINKIGKYLEDCLNGSSSFLVDVFDWWMISAENGHFGINTKLKGFTFYENIVDHNDEGLSLRTSKNNIIL